MTLKLAITLSLLITTSARADFDPTAYPPYETCALCHGLFGVSHTAKFPNLAGQKPTYIRNQIDAFLSGARTNDGGQMAAIVTELDPEGIPVVVEWFSSQEAPARYQIEPSEYGAAQFVGLGCAGCHDNTPDQADHVPYLSAQHASYLEKQMRDFRDKRRGGLPVHTLHLELLSDPAIKLDAIATYLAGEDRP